MDGMKIIWDAVEAVQKQPIVEPRVFNCPQCGQETETLHEGYCEECRDQRQRELNEHNASIDFWDSLSDKEKDFYIRSAAGYISGR